MKWAKWADLNARDSLMLSQGLLVLFHVQHVPWWMPLLAMLVALAELSVLRSRIGLLGWREKLVKIVIFAAGIAAIWLQFGTFLGVEAGVAFLLLCLIGKLLEVQSRRDVYVALNLGLFVIAALFLFDQNLSTTLLAVLGVLATLYSMIAQNDQGEGRWRSLLLITGQALPLLVVLFLLFPRFPPLWTLKIAPSQAKTGMSDHMSPGDISELSQSSALAFRVTVQQGQLPPQPQLYWRGLVLSHFDGEGWRPSRDYRLQAVMWQGQSSVPDWLQNSLQLQRRAPIRYRLSMEPTQQNWLFVLNFSYMNGGQVGISREFGLQTAEPITQRTAFDLYYFQPQSLDANLPDWLAQDSLQLPVGSNPNSVAFARALFAQVGRDPLRYQQAILRWIRQQNFVYTLQPTALRGDRVDQFLFSTRQGFCEHYASAFTFLMRAAGIPARVVVGYQGGQVGPDGQSWEVRQLDAHAWVEVWQQGQGWQRVDPTAAVAPERIEKGLSAMAANDTRLFGQDALAGLRSQRFKFLSQLNNWVDYAGYLWQRDIVGFDQSRQQSALWRWLGIRSLMAQMLLMLGLLLLVVAAVALRLWWRRRLQWHPLDQPLILLSKKVPSPQLARQNNEGMLFWLTRLQAHSTQPQQLQQLAEQYARLRYGASLDVVAQQVAQRQLLDLAKRCATTLKKPEKAQ